MMTLRRQSALLHSIVLGGVLAVVFLLAGALRVYAAPNLDTITPLSASNDLTAGEVTVTISGTGFDIVTIPTVKLTRNSFPDIWMNVTTRTLTDIVAVLPLRGQPAGIWDVVVTNGDGTSDTLDQGFTIEVPEANACTDWGWVRFRGDDIELTSGPYAGCKDCQGTTCRFCTTRPQTSQYGGRELSCSTCSSCDQSNLTCRVTGVSCTTDDDCNPDNPKDTCSVACTTCDECAEFGVSYSSQEQTFYGYAWSGGGTVPIATFSTGRVEAENGIATMTPNGAYLSSYAACEGTNDGCTCAAPGGSGTLCSAWGWEVDSATSDVVCESREHLDWTRIGDGSHTAGEHRRNSLTEVDKWGVCTLPNRDSSITYAIGSLPSNLDRYYVTLSEFSEVYFPSNNENPSPDAHTKERMRIDVIDPGSGGAVRDSYIVEDLNTSPRSGTETCTTGRTLEIHDGDQIRFTKLDTSEASSPTPIKLDWFEVGTYPGSSRSCGGYRIEAEYGIGRKNDAKYNYADTQNCERYPNGCTCSATSSDTCSDWSWQFAGTATAAEANSMNRYVKEGYESIDRGYITKPEGWGAIRLIDQTGAFTIANSPSRLGTVLTDGDPTYVSIRAGFDASQDAEAVRIVQRDSVGVQRATRISTDLTTDTELPYNEWVTCSFQAPFIYAAGDTFTVENASDAAVDVDIDWIEFSEDAHRRGRDCITGDAFGEDQVYNSGRIEIESGFGKGSYYNIVLEDECDGDVTDTNKCSCDGWRYHYISTSAGRHDMCGRMGVETARQDWSSEWGWDSNGVLKDVASELVDIPVFTWRFSYCSDDPTTFCTEDVDCATGTCELRDQFNPPGICVADPSNPPYSSDMKYCQNDPSVDCTAGDVCGAAGPCVAVTYQTCYGDTDCTNMPFSQCIQNPNVGQQHTNFSASGDAPSEQGKRTDISPWERFAQCSSSICDGGLRDGESCLTAEDCPYRPPYYESLSGWGKAVFNVREDDGFTTYRWMEVTVPDDIIPGEYYINWAARYSGDGDVSTEFAGMIVRDRKDGTPKGHFLIYDLYDGAVNDDLSQCSFFEPVELNPGDVLRFSATTEPYGGSVHLDYWQVASKPIFDRACQTGNLTERPDYDPNIGVGWIDFNPTYGGVEAIQAWVETKFGDIYSQVGVGRSEGGAGEAPSTIPSAFNATFVIETAGNDIYWTSEGYEGNNDYLRFQGSSFELPRPTATQALGRIDLTEITNPDGNIYTDHVVETTGSTWTEVKNECFGGSDVLQGIICVVQGNLTIDGQIKVDNGQIETQSGAGTIVVEGNLTINADMEYLTNTVTSVLGQVGSIAWIVEGNITINPDVTTVIGALITLADDGIIATGTHGSDDQQLTVQGLMMAHQFNFQRDVINPTVGSERVVYDGRIIANPPPGTQDITQTLPTIIETFPASP